MVTGVAFAFTDGQIVEVEAMRGRRLRRLAHDGAGRRWPTLGSGDRTAGIASGGMTTFGFQIPGFRHAGDADAEMFDHTVAHAQRRRAAAGSSRCG